MKTIACPSPQRMEALFDGNVAEVELADFSAHLDECVACRERFDNLARPERQLGSASFEPVPPALVSARENLRRQPWPSETRDSSLPPNSGANDAATAIGLELPSGYLEPSNDPRLMG